jgi:hypothetical protein
VVEDRRGFADSGDVQRKGTRKFLLPPAPLLDSFLPDVHIDEAHLRRYSTPSGVASFDGDMTNSGEFVRSDVQNREIWEGVEMEEEKNQFTSELQAIL